MTGISPTYRRRPGGGRRAAGSGRQAAKALARYLDTQGPPLGLYGESAAGPRGNGGAVGIEAEERARRARRAGRACCRRAALFQPEVRSVSPR